jgi:hypothetical protein
VKRSAAREVLALSGFGETELKTKSPSGLNHKAPCTNVSNELSASPSELLTSPSES